MGRILLMALVPDLVIVLTSAGKGQRSQGQAALLGQLPGDVRRGGQQAVGLAQYAGGSLEKGDAGKPAALLLGGGQHLLDRSLLVTAAADLNMPGRLPRSGR